MTKERERETQGKRMNRDIGAKKVKMVRRKKCKKPEALQEKRFDFTRKRSVAATETKIRTSMRGEVLYVYERI